MTDVPSLEARIRRLEDIEALRKLRNRYHAAINDGRYDEIAELFTDDALVVLGYLARYEGRAAIDRGFRGMGERERFFIKQFIHSHDVAVDGDRGTGTDRDGHDTAAGQESDGGGAGHRRGPPGQDGTGFPSSTRNIALCSHSVTSSARGVLRPGAAPP